MFINCVNDDLIMLEIYQAWADMGWVLKGLENRTHTHLCSDCGVELSCGCSEPYLKWGTCFNCVAA